MILAVFAIVLNPYEFLIKDYAKHSPVNPDIITLSSQTSKHQKRFFFLKTKPDSAGYPTWLQNTKESECHPAASACTTLPLTLMKI